MTSEVIEGHIKIKIRFSKDILFFMLYFFKMKHNEMKRGNEAFIFNKNSLTCLNKILSKFGTNANMIKTHIFHNFKLDLKGH